MFAEFTCSKRPLAVRYELIISVEERPLLNRDGNIVEIWFQRGNEVARYSVDQSVHESLKRISVARQAYLGNLPEMHIIHQAPEGDFTHLGATEDGAEADAAI